MTSLFVLRVDKEHYSAGYYGGKAYDQKDPVSVQGDRGRFSDLGEGNLQPIEGTISLNPENYATGAILAMDVKQAGATATFKI